MDITAAELSLQEWLK